MDLILKAILVGFSLSLILIGPIFFLVLEKSISKGWQTALAINMGALTADLICVVLAYFGSRQVLNYVEQSPMLYYIGGATIVAYGLGMLFAKKEEACIVKKEVLSISKGSYVMLFLQGLVLNFMNIGIVVFWFVLMSWITIEYPAPRQTQAFIAITLLTVFLVDLAKILLAERLQTKLSPDNLLKTKRVLSCLLILFGAIIIFKQ